MRLEHTHTPLIPHRVDTHTTLIGSKWYQRETYLGTGLADGVEVKRDRPAASLFSISRTGRGTRAFGFAEDKVETVFAASTLVATHETHVDGIIFGAGR